MHSVHGKSPKKRILPFFSFGFLVLKNIKIKKSRGFFKIKGSAKTFYFSCACNEIYNVFTKSFFKCLF